jgi:signal transduction histidine kinase
VRTDPATERQLAGWRHTTVLAIATARRADQLAGRQGEGSGSRAYALAQAFQVRRWLDSGSNVPPLLRGARFCWPAWLRRDCRAALYGQPEPDEPAGLVRAAWNEIRQRPILAQELIEREERLAWFRTLPGLRAAFIPLLVRLRRLDRLETEFARAVEREKLASLRQLAYGASHEINNPLANISARAQTLLRSEQDAGRREKLAAINRQAFRAHAMIADLMMFAKPPPLAEGQIQFWELLQGVVDGLQPDVARAQAQLALEAGSQRNATVRGDPQQLAVALRACCVNSLEAMAPGGAIHIALQDGGDHHLRVVIRDTGPGIDDAVRRHLFDPFYSGREAGRGLGFGLSKAWRIIGDHGGDIQLESPPGQGAVFSIRLPRSSPQDPVGGC